MFSKTIRQDARRFLKKRQGKWLLFSAPILTSLLYLVNNLYLSSAPMSIAILVELLLLALLGLTLLSAAYALLRVKRGDQVNLSVKDALICFRKGYLFPIIGLYLLRLLLLLPWVLLCLGGLGIILLPIIALLLFFFGGLSLPEDLLLHYDQLVWLGLVAILVGYLGLFNRSYAYSQVYFLYFDKHKQGGDIHLWKLFKRSARLMKGHKFRRFLLDFLLWGWMIFLAILSVTTSLYAFTNFDTRPLTITGFLAIALFLIYLLRLPYLTTCQTFFYQDLLERKMAEQTSHITKKETTP